MSTASRFAKVAERFPAVRQLCFGGRRKIPVVLQMAASDCGSASLCMVLGYLGRSVPLSEVSDVLAAGRDGLTAAALIRAARHFGLQGRALRLEMDDLSSLPAGAILHWEFRHFVVFESAARDHIHIIDPAVGRRAVPIAKFRRSFTGVALRFEAPVEAFMPQSGTTSMSRLSPLWRQLLTHRNFLVRVVGTTFLAQILGATAPLLTGLILDRVIPFKDHSLLALLALGYLVVQAIAMLNGVIRSYLMIHLSTRVELDFGMRFVAHLIDLPYSYFQQHSSGDLMMRFGCNASVREILMSTTLSALLDGSMAAIYLIVLATASLPLTVFVLALAAARVLLLIFLRWRQKQLLAESLDNSAKSQTVQVELLSGMETLKAMGAEDRVAQSWSSLFVEGLNISIRRSKLDILFGTALSLFGILGTMVFLFYGANLVLDGSLSVGMMMAYSALAANFLTPFNSVIGAFLQLQLLDIYVDRLMDVMQTPIEQTKPGLDVSQLITGIIDLRSVSFRYDAQGPLVLEDISLRVDKGSRIALVGRTGSGKSTLAKLLAGLYHPSSGEILFDGHDVRHVDLRSLRSRLGIVTQDTQLFSGSIKRNIALSDPSMPLARIISAAKTACIHDEIMAMSMGYDTILADRGYSLSGGQRQRIALARAIASNPAILILDEATSHLDAKTEQSVATNISQLECTVVIVAHRLSTVRDADQILLLDYGRVAERGTHHDLCAADGSYASLVATQLNSASLSL